MNNMDITVKQFKSKYLIGEKVYAEKGYFDIANKNNISLMRIESILYDKDKKTFIYNYLYKEDELYSTAEDLISFLKTKYYQEYEEKIIKVCDDLKKINERG